MATDEQYKSLQAQLQKARDTNKALVGQAVDTASNQQVTSNLEKAVVMLTEKFGEYEDLSEVTEQLKESNTATRGNADQIKELKGLRLRLRLQAIELQAGRSKAQVHLEAALDEKDVDLESVKKLLHEAGEYEIELRYLAIEAAVKAKRVLTDGQIERLDEMLRPPPRCPRPS